MKRISIETELIDAIFDEDIIENLCIKSKLPFHTGIKVKFTMEEIK